tara:strand:+ start:1805 stop:3124 length:1320 start_codon:yes stop_codon:yes gene_type:complete
MKVTEEKMSSKKLGVFAIWAIGVGMVISGESFGWNLGWAITGPLWFFVPVAVAALMYFGLVQNLIELACVYPEATGPHSYVEKAFGKKWGNFIGLAILFEFLFATPAIASSLGEYLGFLMDDLAMSPWIATGFLLFFSIINLFEMHIGVRFLVVLTLLAIAELFLYQGAVLPSFDLDNLRNSGVGSLDLQGFVAAIPYAVWLFLAIEGISLMTNSIDRNGFRKTITRGYNLAFFTLLTLALLVLVLAAGGIDWSLPESLGILEENHPMPASMALILGKGNFLVQLFTFIGLFGLIASLQGIAFAATTQLEPLLPVIKNNTISKRVLASSLVFLFSLMAIWSSQTGFLIEVSVFGAVCMYLVVSASLLRLRKRNPKSPSMISADILYGHSDFNPNFSGFNAWLAVIISLICIGAFAYLQFQAFIIFIACSLVYVFLIRRN